MAHAGRLPRKVGSATKNTHFIFTVSKFILCLEKYWLDQNKEESFYYFIVVFVFCCYERIWVKFVLGKPKVGENRYRCHFPTGLNLEPKNRWGQEKTSCAVDVWVFKPRIGLSLWQKAALHSEVSIKKIDRRFRNENQSLKNGHFSELHTSQTVEETPPKRIFVRKSILSPTFWYANRVDHVPGSASETRSKQLTPPPQPNSSFSKVAWVIVKKTFQASIKTAVESFLRA